MDVRESEKYRLLQVILGRRGVYEVYGHIESSRLVCSCPGFVHRGFCKHTRLAESKIEADGRFVMDIVGPSDMNDDQILEMAHRDPKGYRDWVLRRSRIEVL